MELLAPLFKSFFLVFVSEFGDKSQLVCMTLAARHRAGTVVIGALGAFILLNLLGVTLGAVVAHWLPEWVLLSFVTVLFVMFGVQSLRDKSASSDDSNNESFGRHVLVSVFLLIFVAEFGDKTQLAVASLAGIEPALWVWLGATLALAATTLIGVVAGRALIQWFPLSLLQKGSGVLFLLFGLWAAFELMQSLGFDPS